MICQAATFIALGAVRLELFRLTPNISYQVHALFALHCCALIGRDDQDQCSTLVVVVLAGIPQIPAYVDQVGHPCTSHQDLGLTIETVRETRQEMTDGWR